MTRSAQTSAPASGETPRALAAVARFFDLRGRGSTFGRELRGGLATFLTMSYILFANPNILMAAGVPFAPAVACTALGAGVVCILMGLAANFPIALASGMGLNAIVAMQLAPKTGSWQAAMGLVVLDGLVVLILVLVGLREAVMHAIPRSLRLAIGAGIGLFIAFLGLVNAKIVAPGPSAAAPLTFGRVNDPATIVALAGLALTAALMIWRVKGALVIGILAATGLGLAIGVAHWPKELGRPQFDILFKADLGTALQLKFLPLLFAIMIVDFFDTLGTATAIAEQAGLQGANGQIPRLRNVLIVDSLGAAIGGWFGVSSVTCYIESAAGVAEGARTGLHSVVVGVLFLLAILLAPLAAVVPAAATAPALILVGFLMIGQMVRIDFDDLETAIPAFITLLLIPLTYSIAHGIGYGFIAFTVLKILRGKYRDVHPLMHAVSAAFAAYFVWQGWHPGY